MGKSFIAFNLLSLIKYNPYKYAFEIIILFSEVYVFIVILVYILVFLITVLNKYGLS